MAVRSFRMLIQAAFVLFLAPQDAAALVEKLRSDKIQAEGLEPVRPRAAVLVGRLGGRRIFRSSSGPARIPMRRSRSARRSLWRL